MCVNVGLHDDISTLLVSALVISQNELKHISILANIQYHASLVPLRLIMIMMLVHLENSDIFYTDNRMKMRTMLTRDVSWHICRFSIRLTG